MSVWIVNWRRNVFVSLLFLLVIGSFSSQTKPLCAGWWIEQQRMGGCGLQVVRRSVVVPVRHGYFQTFLHYLRVKARKDMVILFMRFMLAISGAVWIWVLRWFIMEMMNQEFEPLQFNGVWRIPLSKDSATLEIRMMASVWPDLMKEGNPTQHLILNEAVAHGSEMVLDDRPMTSALLPAASASVGELEKEVVESPRESPAKIKGLDFVENPSKSISTEERVSDCNQRTTLKHYDSSIEQGMKKFYATLSEKDKRRYAAIEAFKLGHGGSVYIADMLGCCYKTVSKGIQELKDLPEDIGFESRVRKPGGGRKRYDVIYPDIDEKFLDVLKHYTAGDPMREGVLWTNLIQQDIADRLAQKHSIRVLPRNMLNTFSTS